jgi:hypothetical protein
MNQTAVSEVGSILRDRYKVYFADDPDPGKAGQGLATCPLVLDILGQEVLDYWLMSPSEQAAMILLLQNLKPSVAIEIGTKLGGSLQVLARFSKKVYSLDIDPEVERRLAGKYPNVEFIIGPSTETLPPLLKRLEAEQANLGFVLVDGDHTTKGVKSDINNVLEFKPRHPLYVVMHDSFNPECRRGLLMAQWARNPHVRAVEIDFVTGTVNPSPAFRGQLWGGLALAILLPEPRATRFEVTARAQITYKRSYRRSMRTIVSSLLTYQRSYRRSMRTIVRRLLRRA